MDEQIKAIIASPPLTHEGVQKVKEGNDYLKNKLKVIEEKKVAVDIPLLPFHSSAGPVPLGTQSAGEFALPDKLRVFSCSNAGPTHVCGNEKSLLICDNDSLLLMDEDFVVREDFLWPHGSIYHLSWIEALRRFLLINDRREVYLVHHTNLSTFQRLQSIPSMNWWSGTVFDKYLYLSTHGASPIVVQADLSQSFQLIKQMKSPFHSGHDEFIQELNTWNEKLIFVVSDQRERISICQVRSPFTFNLLTSIPLSFPRTPYQSSIHSTVLFPPTQRLVFIEENASQMIVVALDETTQTIDYRQPIRNLCSFRRTTLVIRTDRQLVFYQL